MTFTITHTHNTGNRTIISYEVTTASGIVLENSSKTFDYCTTAENDEILESLISEFKIAKLAEWQAVDIEQYLADKQATKTAQKWEEIKQHRNALLAQCDWTQLPDAPLTTPTKEAWRVYRQQLRDLPEMYAEPELVVYPEKAVSN